MSVTHLAEPTGLEEPGRLRSLTFPENPGPLLKGGMVESEAKFVRSLYQHYFFCFDLTCRHSPICERRVGRGRRRHSRRSGHGGRRERRSCCRRRARSCRREVDGVGVDSDPVRVEALHDGGDEDDLPAICGRRPHERDGRRLVHARRVRHRRVGGGAARDSLKPSKFTQPIFPSNTVSYITFASPLDPETSHDPKGFDVPFDLTALAWRKNPLKASGRPLLLSMVTTYWLF